MRVGVFTPLLSQLPQLFPEMLCLMLRQRKLQWLQ